MMMGRASERERVNLPGCFHLDNSRRSSTCDTHEYTCIQMSSNKLGALGPPSCLVVTHLLAWYQHGQKVTPPKFTRQVRQGLGYKSALKQMRNGKAKLVLIAGNFPPLREAEIEYYYAMLSKIAVHHFAGTDVALGEAAGKLLRVGVMTITDPGDSDLFSVAETAAA
ncbi:50S ribosomal protein L30e-like protein [Lactifluus volemus]|nr:50S ribosomal protein L30e-like protein [Lactifluus volemus]